MSAQKEIEHELERVKMEAELARVKAEMLEQRQQLEAKQAQQSKRKLGTRPLDLELSEGFPPSPVKEVVFTPQSLATLTLSVEGGEDAVVTVQDSFTVGRKKGNDLVIRDLHVSSQHAKLVVRKDGVFEIADLNSSGGTFVNGERIERCALENGDKIEFATVAAIFRYVAGGQLGPDDEIDGTLVRPKVDVARQLTGRAKSVGDGLLTVLTADEQSKVVPSAGQITIGRTSGNDVVISEEHVSGRHARLVGNGHGAYELFDLGSSCGTFVNGTKVEQKLLSSGDRLRFGIVDCVFIVGGSQGTADAVPRPLADKAFGPLPQVPESGVSPLPEPKPAGRAGDQTPLVKR